MSLATIYGSKKKKKKKKKKVGLAWGNPKFPGVAPAGETAGFSGGMGETLLRTVISSILSENKE